jgi:hypothetical protein
MARGRMRAATSLQLRADPFVRLQSEWEEE